MDINDRRPYETPDMYCVRKCEEEYGKDWYQKRYGNKRTWEERAARKINNALSRAVKENTKIHYGFFSGVSMQDIIDIIIEEHKKG
jgi:hypothetical protein